MAVHNTQGKSSRSATLPDVVPFDLAHLTRQSWELGVCSIQNRQATRLGIWSHQNDHWRLSIFEVTSETAIIRIQTPVGRERFYGAIQSELRSAIQKLESDPSWQQIG